VASKHSGGIEEERLTLKSKESLPSKAPIIKREVNLKIDPESLNWLETELNRIRYGEVGLIFILHDGRITKRKKILEIKEQEDLTNMHDDI